MTQRFPMVTVAIAVANVAVFLLMLTNARTGDWTAEFLLGWGADFAPLTLGGQPWRLLTSTFVHLSLPHIASNMLCLFYWGPVTERALGWRKFAATYLLCGVSASLVSVALQPHIVSAGASGALAGLLGVMLVMWLRGDPRVSRNGILTNIGLNVLIAFAVPVDWIAHAAGFVAGVLLGLVFVTRWAPVASPARMNPDVETER